jgi:hypothetical protein
MARRLRRSLPLSCAIPHRLSGAEMGRRRGWPSSFAARWFAHRTDGSLPHVATGEGSLPPPLPPDVDPNTAVCANGFVRVGPSPGRGLGAFARLHLRPHHDLGCYHGEVFRGISELHARYGVDGDIADEHYVWHTTWREERRSRGVLATGTYVVKAGSCPLTGRIVFVDAEDPIISSWQRYINHSAKRPNLVMSSVVLPDGEPLVRFRVERDVQPGDE